MSTRSLGTLTLDLIAKIGGFEAGMDKAARKARSSSIDIQKYMLGIGKGIAALGATAVVSTAALVKSQIDFADQVSKTSRIVGMSVEELSALNYQADLSGVSFEELTAAMTKFSRVVDKAMQGNASSVEVFERLGVSIRNADGVLKGNSELLQEVADKFSVLADGAAKTAMAQDLFGRSGAKLIPLLSDGRDGMEAYRAEAERLGQVLDTDSAKAAEEFNDNLTRLGKIISGVGNELAAALLPQLVEFTDLVKDPEFQQGVKNIVIAIAEISLGVGNFVREVSDLKEQFSLFGRAIVGRASDLELLEREIKDVERALRGGLSTPIKFLGTPDEDLKVLRTRLMAERDVLVAELSGAKIKDFGGLTIAISDLQSQIGRLKTTYERLGPLDIDPEGRNKIGLEQYIKQLETTEAKLKSVRDAAAKTLGNSAPTGSPISEYTPVAPDFSGVGADLEANIDGYEELVKNQEELHKASVEYQEDIQRQIALMGVETESAKALYETESGRFAMLDDATKKAIIANAKMIDQAKAQLDLQQQITEIQELLMTDAEKINAVWEKRIEVIRNAGLEQAKTDELIKKAEAKRAEELKGAAEKSKDAMSEFALQAQRNIQDQFADSIYDALTGDFDNILQDWDELLKKMGAQLIAQKLLTSLGGWLGGDAASGGGGGGGAGSAAASAAAAAGGGNWWSAAAGMFAGMFDAGGQIRAGQWGIVGERGPELVTGPATIIGREATGQMLGGGRQVNQNLNVTLTGRPDKRTPEQIARAAAREARRAISRSGG